MPNNEQKQQQQQQIYSGPRLTTLKKVLNAGKGPLPDYRKDTKALFHYEVFLPPEPSPSSLALLRGGNAEDSVERKADAVEQAKLLLFPEDRSLYKCIDSTKQPWPNGYGKPLELVFGKKFQLPLFEECLRTMLVNEISQFDVYEPRELLTFPMVSKKLRDIGRAERDPVFARQHDQAQQHHHCAASIAQGLGYPELDELQREGPRPLRFVFHLLEVWQPEQYAVDNWQLDETQRSAQIDRLRAQGNELYAQKQFAQASDKYREALTLLDQLLLREKPSDPEWLELDRRNVPLYLNLAQCFLHIGKFYDAASCATEALQREPNNGKALYRRAKARMQTWDLDQAETDLKRMWELGQERALVEATLRDLEQKRHEQQAQQQKAYRAMFKGVPEKGGGVKGGNDVDGTNADDGTRNDNMNE